MLGPEIEENDCKAAVIVRVLNGLKSVGASFRSHLAQCMWKLGYFSCDVNPDMWMKAEYRPEDKLVYYSYILCYVDNILCIHHDTNDVLNKLNQYMPLKLRSVGSLNFYLSKNLTCMQLNNGIWAWFMSPLKYVKSVRICKGNIAKHLIKCYQLPKRAENTFESGYCPEQDVSSVLGLDEASYH